MKMLGWVAILVGLIFLITAGVYFTTPAHSLPSFFPGYDRALSKIHRTHAIAAFFLGLVCFAFAWFETGKKSSKEK